jgi:hypothetical protein
MTLTERWWLQKCSRDLYIFCFSIGHLASKRKKSPGLLLWYLEEIVEAADRLDETLTLLHTS